METSVSVGNRVSTTNGTGIVRFVGTTSFAGGKWIGVELDGPTGKNNGSIQGKSYFTCRNGHGVFVRPAGVKLVDAPPRRNIDETIKGKVRERKTDANVRLRSRLLHRNHLD